jgi:hypothetical protein
MTTTPVCSLRIVAMRAAGRPRFILKDLLTLQL